MATTLHLTLDRPQEQLAREGITVYQDPIWRFLHRKGLHFKIRSLRKSKCGQQWLASMRVRVAS